MNGGNSLTVRKIPTGSERFTEIVRALCGFLQGTCFSDFWMRKSISGYNGSEILPLASQTISHSIACNDLIRSILQNWILIIWTLHTKSWFIELIQIILITFAAEFWKAKFVILIHLLNAMLLNKKGLDFES